MSDKKNEEIALQVIESFLSEGKQFDIVIAIDDFDKSSEYQDNCDDRLSFYLHDKATAADLDSHYNIARKYNYINDGVAFILVDTSCKLNGYDISDDDFSRREKHLYCEYQFLLDAVKQDRRVVLAIEKNEIILKKA